MVVEVTDLSTLQHGSVLVDFYSRNCAPCKAMNPFLEEVSNKYGVKVAKVDILRNPGVSQMYGVMSVPTVMVLKDAKVKEISRGYVDKKSINSLVEKHFVSSK